MRRLGASSLLGLLDEGLDLAGDVGDDHAVAGRVLDRVQGDGALGAGGVVEADQPGHVEVGEHVAVDDDEALVDARLAGGEADGTGGVERLVLDGVRQRDAGALAVGIGVEEGVGLVAERQDGFGDAVARPGGRRPARPSGTCTTAGGSSAW